MYFNPLFKMNMIDLWKCGQVGHAFHFVYENSKPVTTQKLSNNTIISKEEELFFLTIPILI